MPKYIKEKDYTMQTRIMAYAEDIYTLITRNHMLPQQ